MNNKCLEEIYIHHLECGADLWQDGCYIYCVYEIDAGGPGDNIMCDKYMIVEDVLFLISTKLGSMTDRRYWELR